MGIKKIEVPSSAATSLSQFLIRLMEQAFIGLCFSGLFRALKLYIYLFILSNLPDHCLLLIFSRCIDFIVSVPALLCIDSAILFEPHT